MAKLARDTIPFDQEQVVRNFLGGCEFVRLTLPRVVRNTLIALLGYKVAPNGALIWNTIECKWRLGENHSTNWIDTFDSDWETLCEEREEETESAIDADSAADSGPGK
jgi:hypothetical protein